PDSLWVGSTRGSIIRIDNQTLSIFDDDNGILRYDDRSLTVTAIAQNPDNPTHLLAGGRIVALSAKSHGLYESLDDGQSWNFVPGMPGARDIWEIAFDPHFPRAFIATSSGTVIYEYTMVPEPASLLALMIAGPCLLFRRQA
ncbi:MAG: PEP-CTERM sorting domain-containing protein, partial [Phycisphaerales bacterium]|nr:PEP-CTERM sorting domain-containing protein [Phycisphaerales bacterium]